MPRVKRGIMSHKRHKKIIKAAKGYFGGKKNLFKTANEAVQRSGNFAYRDRRNKKREFRKLWITRISAACRSVGTTYSVFIAALTRSSTELDRKVLSDLAIRDPQGFNQVLITVGITPDMNAPVVEMLA
ncbi:MAG: 50S ribosomal protein L20 [Akkermansiaceae bacterium]|nr:50S ribosomal protein L20 [Armatimonadota bacterium]